VGGQIELKLESLLGRMSVFAVLNVIETFGVWQSEKRSRYEGICSRH
jgi:uncharacterized membrane protein (DUF2068 family)